MYEMSKTSYNLRRRKYLFVEIDLASDTILVTIINKNSYF